MGAGWAQEKDDDNDREIGQVTSNDPDPDFMTICSRLDGRQGRMVPPGVEN